MRTKLYNKLLLLFLAVAVLLGSGIECKEQNVGPDQRFQIEIGGIESSTGQKQSPVNGNNRPEIRIY